jgi:hypothetical protein
LPIAASRSSDRLSVAGWHQCALCVRGGSVGGGCPAFHAGGAAAAGRRPMGGCGYRHARRRRRPRPSSAERAANARSLAGREPLGSRLPVVATCVFRSAASAPAAGGAGGGFGHRAAIVNRSAPAQCAAVCHGRDGSQQRSQSQSSRPMDVIRKQNDTAGRPLSEGKHQTLSHPILSGSDPHLLHAPLRTATLHRD